MNKLIQEIIKPILEANPKIKKIIGIYGGRFQPFGPHHKKVYEWLSGQFDDAYITTSNIKKLPRHPMNFKEKVRHMVKMGIPSSKIALEKTPFVAKKLLSKFNSDTTAVVYIFGKKDAGRLSGGKYFQDYKKNKDNLSGHEEHGYYLVAPHMSVSAGGLEVSGTSMRELLGSDKFDDSERQKLFKKMFGYFDKGIYQMMTNKFKKLFESEINVVPYSKSRKKPVDPKLFDKKKRDLLKGAKEKDLSPLEKKQIILLGRAMKEMPGSPKQKAIKKQINVIRKKLGQKPIKEAFTIPIEIGDTVMMGKFKNKKVVVKSIDINEKGDLVINGKSASKFRLVPKPNIFDESKDKIEECITIAKMFDGDMVLGKNRDRNYKPKLKIVRDRTSYGIEVCYVIDVDTDWTEGMNELGVGVVNSALFVKRDEKDYDKAKKKMAPSKDGVRVREALGKGTFADAVKSLATYHGGIKGHTTVGNGKKLVTIENTSRTHPVVKIKDLNKEPVVRTNHGIEHSEAGYQRGNDKLSSELRMINALNVTHSTNHWKNLFPNVYDHTQDKGPKYDLVRAQNKLWTSSQVAMNLNKKEIILYLIPGQVEFIGVENHLPKGYESKIKFKVIKHEPKETHNESVFSKDWWKDLLEASSNAGGYSADPGEPDTGLVPGGKKRKLGTNSGKPEDWFNRLDFTQVDFPEADYVRGKGDTPDYVVKKIYQPTEEPLQQDADIAEPLITLSEGLLLEGGAYGHMAHPFDDKDLTFGDLKNIITNGLGGTLNREDNVTEKLDGQNIMISWKDGKLIAARNKGHIKNGGATALTKKGIASKFEGRGNIANAFNFAMNDLEKAIGSLSEKQRTKIFNNGYNFMNMEVMWPASANVIDYDVANLVFHGALIYDDKGNVKGEVKGSARMLAGMIQQVNQHIQKKYSIGKPNFLTVPKHQDFGKMKGKFLGRLSKLQSEFGLKESDTLALYHQKWWEKFITNESKGKITQVTLEGLVKRWAFFDKSYKIPQIRKDLEGYPEFLEWVLKFDSKDHSTQVKKNMKPFEELFFEVGAEILKNVQGFIAANPDKAVQGINKRLTAAISDVRKGGDLKKLNRLKVQLDRLNAIGGTQSIVPSEGIVFKYKGKTYKFTGAFAPVNQITGLVSF